MPDVYRVALRAAGRVLSVEPGKPAVEYRDKVGPWETVELLKHADGYSARFVDADVLLAIAPNGELQTRPASARGAWETFQVTEQPNDWKTVLLFRRENGWVAGGVVLEVVQ